MIEQLFAFFRIAAHPIFDDFGGHLMQFVNPATHHFSTYGAIVVAVRATKTDAQETPVRQTHAARALDLQEEQFHWIVYITNLKVETVHHPIFKDLTARVPLTCGLGVFWHGVDRIFIARGLRARTVKLWLEIPCEHHLFAVFDQQRAKEQLEKRARVLLILSSAAQGFPVRCFHVAASAAKRIKRCLMIVFGPTV